MNDRRIEKNIITNMIHGMMYENELGMNSLSIHHMKSNIAKDKYLLNLNQISSLRLKPQPSQ